MLKDFQFAHLHSHTDHSALDGHASVKELAEHVFKSGQIGFGVTDHGSMSNIYNGWAAAKAIREKYGVPFYFTPGIEAYVTPGDAHRSTREAIFFSNGSREDKAERSNDVSGGGSYTHMTMLGETTEGMHNLFRLNTLAWHEGIHRKPRMDIESIAQYSKGVIATTGCPSGELQTRLRLGQWGEAMKYASKMQDIFGKENYYLELMDHNMTIDLERRVRGDLMKVAKELQIPLLATNDLHYVRREDAKDHEHMLCLQSGSSMLDKPYDLGGKRFAFEGEEYYAKETHQMLALFPHEEYPFAVQNAAEIAMRSTAEFKYNPDLRPSVPLPEGHDEHSFLREMVYDGLSRKRPDKVNDQEYIDRIEKELGVLKEKNFSGYMLVVSDFTRWAKAQGWRVGPGRGCLSGDTMIPTIEGYKRLDEIEVGDKSFDENGEIVEVPAVFEWDCDEDLIEISTYYGGAPVKMTNDHKVLVSKANRVTSKRKISQGYAYETDAKELAWIRADEIDVGDLLVTPRLKMPDTFEGLHLDSASVAVTNISSDLSTRSIARETSLSRSAVMRYLKGEKISSSVTADTVDAYLASLDMSISDSIEARTVSSMLSIEGDFIPANRDLGIILGLFISDGWIRSKGNEIGFAQRRSEDEQYIPDVFRRVFGAELTTADHASADLRQYRSSHKGIVQLFRVLFPNYEFKASTKSIPAALLQSNVDFREGLLEGLWYGDGCFSGKTVYSTVSRELAYDVHQLLGTLGIHSGVTENKRTETRPAFNASGREYYMEYKVISAPFFDESRVINGMGKSYDGKFMYSRVRKIQTTPSSGKVYDFRVDTTNSYVTESFVVHNSGGGSSVAFFTDITEIDPIPHGLIFERFLNPERDSPPDIDSDFDEHREEVIEYVRQKYGEEMVSMIITIGVIKAKSAIKDMARIYEEPYSVGEVLTKALPKPVAGKEISLKEAFDPESARYDEAEGFRDEVRKLENKNLIPYALGIEGKMRQWGVHAAGVIMSKTPIKDSIPLMMRAKDNVTITQFDYPTCEDLGLIKMDFLGLRNLTVINKCIKAIEKNHGITLVPEEIYDSVLENPDQKTFDIINSGRTIGIFQLDSTDITSLARLIHVTEFNDISAILALYRPGPMGMNSHINYADRKNGRAPITPIHPDLDEALHPILAETFQVICYQEQIQFIAQKVAGYSLGRADILRRAMGKKKKSILDAEFIPFSEGMKANGYKDDAIDALWETLIPFAEYGFNKCLHGRTRVVLENGQTTTIKELQSKFDSGEEEIRILSMFEDGSIRPHLVKDVVKSGLKPLWTIRTKAGRSIQLTEEHRLLSVDGYGTIEDGGLHVGQELIVESEKKTFHISEDDRNRRKNHISSYNKTDIARENARQRMVNYQSTLSYDDRSAHQQRVQIANPDRNVIGKSHAVAKLRDLWANDTEWQSNTLVSFRQAKRALYDTGRGFGKTTVLSDGRITDSMVEALAAEYLLDRGVEFELHKQFIATNGKVRETDFYVQGIYFEMDGLNRGRQWFADNKYGESIPFVYLTPQNYVDEIDAALMRHGIENGDEIVEILPPKRNKTDGVYREMTYDIEMDSSGPANFIANGIVSHNSHSAGYALISYLTAYLKANYGAEFMAANLSTMTDDKEKTAIYLQECRQMGITVLPPDVSISTADYTATKDGIILVGLEAIRGVGHEVAESLNREVIENGKFKNLDDFLARAPSSTLSKTALEGFAHAGALDGFGYSRRSMHKFMPEVATGFAQAKKKQDAGQFSLFDMVEESESPKADIQNLPEYTKKDKLMFERHALGLYVSDHPLSGIANMLERFCDTQALDIISGAEKPSGGGFGDRKILRLAGVANSVIKKPTRKGGMFATFELEDISGTIPCLIFPKAYERLGDLIFSDSIYQISGSLLEGDSEDDIKFAVDTIEEIALTESGQIPFEIQLGVSQATEEALQELQSALLQSPGEMPVHLIVRRADGRSHTYELGEEFKVNPTTELLQQIRMLFGVRSVI